MQLYGNTSICILTVRVVGKSDVGFITRFGFEDGIFHCTIGASHGIADEPVRFMIGNILVENIHYGIGRQLCPVPDGYRRDIFNTGIALSIGFNINLLAAGE